MGIGKLVEGLVGILRNVAVCRGVLSPFRRAAPTQGGKREERSLRKGWKWDWMGQFESGTW